MASNQNCALVLKTQCAGLANALPVSQIGATLLLQ